ncbi:MAG: hypothetical protein KIS96_08935 [Bauldia sp.]|nr:hypothetical protein [Bauldia sp.]
MFQEHQRSFGARAVAVLASTFALGCGAAFAQIALPDQSRWAGNEIRFCINSESVLADLDRAVAQAVADALLIPAIFTEIGREVNRGRYDFLLPVDEMGLLAAFTQNCQVVTGFRLSARAPFWVTVTPAYYTTRVALALAPDADQALPPGSLVATRLAGPGDATLVSYLSAMPASRAWQRTTYRDNSMLLDALFGGAIDAAVIWEPAVFAATAGDPAARGVEVVTPPFEPVTVAFGMALLSTDVYLRALLDNAIASVLATDAVSGFARELGLPPPL